MPFTYTEYDPNKPLASNNPAGWTTDDVTNQRALRDAVLTGRVPGFVQSRAQGTGPDVARPQFITWLNATLSIGFRQNITWGGTGNAYANSVQWEWTSSTDYPTTWTAMGSASAVTYDGNDNITATSNAGGWYFIILEMMVKVAKVVASFAAHIAGTGSSVHGLGTLSTQNANAIAATGGSINGTTVGGTTAAAVDATRARESFTDLGAIGAGGTATLDASAAGHYAFTPNATTSATLTLAISNPPAAGKTQTIMFEIVNGRRDVDGRITYPASFHWVGGSGSRVQDQVLELSGRNLYSATTKDGGTVWDVMHLGKRG